MIVSIEYALEARTSLQPAAPALCGRSEDPRRPACAPPSFHGCEFHGCENERVLALGDAHPLPTLFLHAPDDPDPCMAPFRRSGAFPRWSAS